MGVLKIDVSNPDLFKTFDFKVMTPGKHLLEVANDLEIVSCKPPSENSIIKVELVCQDEDDNKGARAWENLVIINNPTTEKQVKAVKIQQSKLCQFAVACGVITKDEIEAGGNIELGLFKGTRCEAITRVETSTDASGKSTGKQNTRIVRYLFESEKS